MPAQSLPPTPIDTPAPVVVLFGGSFDPPHRAHLEFARLIADSVAGSAVVMVPAARSPFKIDEPGASGEDRVAMLRAGLADVGLGPDRACVWTDELDRGGATSYFIDTLRRARSVLPANARLRFVIGSDQLAVFHRWRDAHAILSLASPLVLMRGGGEMAAGHEVVDRAMTERVLAWLRREGGGGAWSDDEIALLAAGLIPGQNIADISSTRVRALLADDPSSPSLGSLLTPGVLAFIRRHELYTDAAES